MPRARLQLHSGGELVAAIRPAFLIVDGIVFPAFRQVVLELLGVAPGFRRVFGCWLGGGVEDRDFAGTALARDDRNGVRTACRRAFHFRVDRLDFRWKLRVGVDGGGGGLFAGPLLNVTCLDFFPGLDDLLLFTQLTGLLLRSALLYFLVAFGNPVKIVDGIGDRLRALQNILRARVAAIA